ncbi:hypothetical protein EDD16DRAFT_293133 [Pisolithus croceorrhizus]|nr:hypothetical protein EDD16DRAFT_293133 [Pisolithus croceorrhizus]
MPLFVSFISLSPHSCYSPSLHNPMSTMANAFTLSADKWLECDSETRQLPPVYYQGWFIGISFGVVLGELLLILLLLVYGILFLSYHGIYVSYMSFFITSQELYPAFWPSLASCFCRRGRGSFPEERPTGMSCQPPKPTTQTHVFPDRVPMQDMLPVYNDFGASSHH